MLHQEDGGLRRSKLRHRWMIGSTTSRNRRITSAGCFFFCVSVRGRFDFLFDAWRGAHTKHIRKDGFPFIYKHTDTCFFLAFLFCFFFFLFFFFLKNPYRKRAAAAVIAMCGHLDVCTLRVSNTCRPWRFFCCWKYYSQYLHGKSLALSV